MANIKQNNIDFNSYKDRGGQTINFAPIRIKGQQGPNEDGGIINAVDIDWNGAQLATSYTGETFTTINTTGELLGYIQGKVNESDIAKLLSRYIEPGSGIETRVDGDKFVINTSN